MVQRPRPDLRGGAQQYAFVPQLRGAPGNRRPLRHKALERVGSKPARAPSLIETTTLHR